MAVLRVAWKKEEHERNPSAPTLTMTYRERATAARTLRDIKGNSGLARCARRRTRDQLEAGAKTLIRNRCDAEPDARASFS
jgi:hypothetical protein